jgi:phosphoribosylanthranilate isomerase
VIRVKICGVTDVDDAQAAAALGASAIGLVFWPRSPRAIDVAAAAAVVERLPAHVTAVGVFVDQSVDEVAAVVARVGLGAVQLHGDERWQDYERALRPLIKATPVGDDFSAASLDDLPPHVTALLDVHDPVRRGGVGRRIDWRAAASAARRRPILLAGGLTPDNVGEAVRLVRPWGVDVSSGVERAPGRKDHDKLRAFFAACRDAALESPSAREERRA